MGGRGRSCRLQPGSLDGALMHILSRRLAAFAFCWSASVVVRCAYRACRSSGGLPPCALCALFIGGPGRGWNSVLTVFAVCDARCLSLRLLCRPGREPRTQPASQRGSVGLATRVFCPPTNFPGGPNPGRAFHTEACCLAAGTRSCRTSPPPGHPVLVPHGP